MVNKDAQTRGIESQQIAKDLIARYLEYYEQNNERQYTKNSKEIISKIAGLPVKKIQEIITSYYNDKYKGETYQNPNLMYKLTFGSYRQSYSKFEQACKDNGFELVTTPSEWYQILHESGKAPHEVKVYVKCENGHVTDKTLGSIKNAGCRHCGGKYKNQRITHAIGEGLLGLTLEEEAKLIDKLKEIGIDMKYEEFRRVMDVFRMSLDTFAELNIPDGRGNVIENILRDKDGNIIKDRFGNTHLHIAIEAQGAQHYDNDLGFKTFLYLNNYEGKCEKLKSESEKQELKRDLRRKWRNLLQRDNLKRVAFKNNNKNGYYLIAVNNKLTTTEKVKYIVNQLYIQAGIDLYYMLDNIKLNEIISRTNLIK